MLVARDRGSHFTMAEKLDGYMTSAQIIKASAVKDTQVTNLLKALRDLRPQLGKLEDLSTPCNVALAGA